MKRYAKDTLSDYDVILHNTITSKVGLIDSRLKAVNLITPVKGVRLEKLFMISEHLMSFMHILEALGHQRTNAVTVTLIYLLRCSKCYQLFYNIILLMNECGLPHTSQSFDVKKKKCTGKDDRLFIYLRKPPPVKVNFKSSLKNKSVTCVIGWFYWQCHRAAFRLFSNHHTQSCNIFVFSCLQC